MSPRASGTTLASVVAHGTELHGKERDGLARWAVPFDRDVRGAVAACPSCRWLGALAVALDQRLVWWAFREDVDDTVPARAEAMRRIDAGERVETGFSDEELVEAAKRLREGDPEARRAALDLLGEQHERWQVTELGYALSLRASDEALDARLDELRGRLDLARMERALAGLPASESKGERELRILREEAADKEEIRAMGMDHPHAAGLWGAASGRAVWHARKARKAEPGDR